MLLSVQIGTQTYRLSSPPVDIGIPLHFNGPQPNTYGVPAAEAHAYEDQAFVGDVNRGGSCNFESYRFVPHCNGTHTECLGHLSQERYSIHELLAESLIPASLLSVPLSQPSHSGDSYQPPLGENDLFVSSESLREALAGVEPEFLQALIIRTLPNEVGKKSRNYMEEVCPFFSNEAMRYIFDLGVRHLLVDFPSVDRLFDEGRLSNHRIFWGMEQGSLQLPPASLWKKTITEMVFVEDELPDGNYLLELQMAAFMADASPSRPRLFALIKT